MADAAGPIDRGPGPPPAKNMAWIPRARFPMGSTDFYPEERPVHAVGVDGFWMDEHPVTVAEFRRFVKATAHVTAAERPPTRPTTPTPIPSCSCRARCVPHAAGPGARSTTSGTGGRGCRAPTGATRTDPAARSTAATVTPSPTSPTPTPRPTLAWAGKALPTRGRVGARGRGGLDGAVFPWGDELAPKGRPMANTWQGRFPWENLCEDGFPGTSPVKSFPPNGYGLYDVAGNVWEWTADFFAARHGPDVRRPAPRRPCCAPAQPPGHLARRELRRRPRRRALPRRGDQGWLAPLRAELLPALPPAARQAETMDTSTTHIGFRGCVRVG